MAVEMIPRSSDVAPSLHRALRRARYAIPRAPRTFVPRAPLVAQLASVAQGDGTKRGVTIVSAPVGSGKTTLVAAMARECPPGSVAWCTLTPADNDRHEFSLAVLEAVLARHSDGVTRATMRGRASGDALDEAVTIAAYGGPMMLVLDECEHIALAKMHETIFRLVRQAPPTMSIVLVTNHDVQLRARSQDRVTSLRTADLAFTVDDFRTLFALHRLEMSGDDLARLAAWTNGSASAAVLAVAALRDALARDDTPPVLVRDDISAHVALFDGVLARLSPEHLAVAIASSIVDPVSGDLAAVVSGIDGAGSLLTDLARMDVFFEPVPDCNGWYRHRHPSRELLGAELVLRHADDVAGFHRRAARWFAAEDHPDVALDSAIQGDDWELVCELVQSRWTAATIDELDPGLSDVPVPPDDAATRSIDAMLATAALAIEHRDLRRSTEWLDRASAVVALANRRPLSVLFEALLRLRCARDASDAGAIEEAVVSVRDWCASNTSLPSVAKDASLLAARADAEAHLIRGDLAGAVNQLERAANEALASGRDRQAASATASLAVVTALMGRVRRARALVEELGDAWFASATFEHGVRETARAICEYHADDVAAAQVSASEARTVLRAGVYNDVVLTAVRARVAVSIGDEVGASRLWARAASSAEPELLAAVADSLGLPARGAGNPSREVHPYAGARASALAALRLYEAEQFDAAWNALEHALALVERNAYLRLFVDLGHDAHGLLRDYIGMARPFSQVAWQELQLLRPDRPDDAPPMVEALTERELAVLRYLPTMKSNREIAAEMFFSVNTVKTHLKSIYRKLGVNRRREAVDEARARSLL